ncbi:MAG: hypothetical protein QMD05_04390 [Candidatus Brocadiaceae bacterium]|nr:hypothetical protein [Candidatus Brocadiaceae bacterium]
MRKYNPYRNVFYYYRGPSSKIEGQYDKQIEDNTTKALINTLENSEKRLLMSLLKEIEIDIKHLDRVAYDLQVGKELSRPDAQILIDNKYDIRIESKIDSPLKEDQICQHLKSISSRDGYLICITPREGDKNVVQQINKANMRFITWKEVYMCFKEQLEKARDEKTQFIIQAFLEYLEAINMAPFNGWDKKDFEAFLNIEDDPRKELRLRVKEKLKQYLVELQRLLKKEPLFEDLELDVGNIAQDDLEVWGVLCNPPLKEKIQRSHLNFSISSNGFFMGVTTEGKIPATNLRNRINCERGRFLKILRKLGGYYLIIQEREKVQPRYYNYLNVAEICLRKDITPEDIDYIFKKTGQYELFAIKCGTRWKRDYYDETLNKASFLEDSVKWMKSLQDYYEFALGGNS